MADEDGWITVTKGSRTSAPESKKMREDEPLSHQDEKRKQKKVSIYSFSIILVIIHGKNVCRLTLHSTTSRSRNLK